MKLKKLILSVVLILAFFVSNAAANDCLLSIDTNLWIYNIPNNTWFTAHTTKDQRVRLLEKEKQPDKEYLKRFDVSTDRDWSDAVLAFDVNNEVYIMVHRKDLTCDGDI
jgi:hypothetical protein